MFIHKIHTNIAPMITLTTNNDDDTKYCDITGETMTEGWVANDGEMYFKYEKDALAWCIENGYESIEDAYENEAIYWTEWED